MATTLTDQQLTQLREEANRQTCRFIDSTQLRRVTEFTAGRGAWASAVLGAPFAGIRALTMQQMVLLDLAADAEPEPPEPPRVPCTPSPREQAAAAHARAAHDAWKRLVDQLPVRVGVAYNYSGPLHVETYLSGADHIIPTEPVHVGRLHRSEHSSLCCTPSRSSKLHFDRLDAPEDRTPTCKECLRTAYRIAGATPDPALLSLPSKQATSRRIR